jgi:pyruvate dehydrogenase E2 component (dihydrolipoamide acetyltransferase)
VAISLRQGGLIAPALHDTDQQSLDELMKKFRDLVNRVRAGSLRSSELSDPTITVTSLGDQGVETVFGIIYPPQVALVGFGKMVERPWCVEGQIVPRPVIRRRCRPTIASATATAAGCSSRPSIACCRSRTSYER